VSIALRSIIGRGLFLRDSDEVVEETSVDGLCRVRHVYSSFEFRLPLEII